MEDFFAKNHHIYLLYCSGILLLFIMTWLMGLGNFWVHIPLILAAIPIVLSALSHLRHGFISTELFLTCATIVSFIGHQEQAMTIVLLIMLAARYLEMIIEQRTERAIKSLINLIPTEVYLKKGTEEKEVPLSHVQPGMTIIIRTGARIPVDGRIIEGTASINEAALTGESDLQEKSISQAVFAGTFVEAGSVVILVEKIGENTIFGKITAFLLHADESKAPITVFANRVARWLVPTLLVFIAGVWFFTGNLRLVTTLLVFGSPLELTLVTPLTVLAGVAAAFRNGILVKSGLSLETFSKATTIIFDKTGTLTLGEPHITGIKSLNSAYSEKDILTIAAVVEKRSNHALSKALRIKTEEEHMVIPDPDNYQSLAGHGVTATYQGKEYMVGNRHFIEEHGHTLIEQNVAFQEGNETLQSIHFIATTQGVLCGALCVSDTLREDAHQLIDYLKNEAKIPSLVLLSGDKQDIASHVATSLGISEAYGQVLPEQKLSMIKERQDRGEVVVMLGDGINDAPALAQADVGIAMGAMGMEPAIEAADIVFMANNLKSFIFLVELSRKVLRTIKQNIFLGFIIFHTFGMTLAFLGILNPIKAALFHALPDGFILINSARLINFKGKQS